MVTIFIITILTISLLLFLSVIAIRQVPYIESRNSLNRDIQTATNTIENLNKQIEQGKNELQAAKDTIKEAEIAAEFLKVNSEEIEEKKQLVGKIDGQLNEMKDLFSARQKELQSVENELSSIKQELGSKEYDLNRINQELEKKTSTVSDLENMERTLQEKIAKFRPEAESLSLEKKRLEVLNNELKESVSELKAKQKALDNDVDKSTAALNKLTNDIDIKNRDIKHLDAELQEKKDKISDLESKINELNNKYIEAKNAVESKSSELKVLEDQNNELKESVSELKNKQKALDNEVDKSTSSLNKLLNDIDTKNQEINLLEAELREKRDKNSKLESKIDELNNKYIEAKNAVESKNSELEVLETLNNEYNEKIKKNKEEVSKLSADIHDKNDQINNLTKDLANIKKQISDYGDDKEIAKHVWEDLDRGLIDMQDKDSSLMGFDEIEWLEEFKDNLETNGILFHDRTVNAFHTGLKSADSSPLLVLAGISGTGKSLLPQLYAEASGMNFIPVAVQPRWDSPQDMLGFYNYMQNRYKATELSRLLWQFDYFNNPKVADSFENQGDLPMNLILLDEMNLARVEYYFSDMLSKLEVRRTIDESNAESRSSAEIEIECGSISGVANSRRLFVGRNNLFVGTMNEDETTQSLSDKVVDRSNVLRFGKPENLQSKPNIDKFRDNYKDIFYLTLEHWNLNRPKINQKLSDELRSTMDTINTALEKVNRPFAHRVWQSVENYVNFYPNVANRVNYNYALADQIEMKILPKLNGLPKDSKIASEALDEIGNVINTIGDDKLTSTYTSIKEDQDNMFFQWKGVVR